MSYSSNFLAEKFIQTVVRAFYTDSVVVVIDALVREKYIREEELGPRLRMSQKQARETIAMLLDIEMLVKFEEVSMAELTENNEGRKQLMKYYYIDYQSFVNMIRYRVHKMMSLVISQEKSHAEEIYFECPTCKSKYSSLQAMKQRSADYKFICPSCCPDFDISKTVSQSWYRLKEIDNRGKLSDVQRLEKKIKEQFSRSIDHEGILEMLEDLKDVPLSRNRPSTNIRRGIRTSSVKNVDTMNEIQEIVNSKSSISKQTVDIKDRHFNLLSTRLDGTAKVVPSAADASTVASNAEDMKISSDVNESDRLDYKRIRINDMPSFLNESGVKGASAVMQEVQAMHLQRGIASAVNLSGHANDFSSKGESSNLGDIVFSRDTRPILAISKDKEGNEDDGNEGEDKDKEGDDDIQWEEEDE